MGQVTDFACPADIFLAKKISVKGISRVTSMDYRLLKAYICSINEIIIQTALRRIITSRKVSVYNMHLLSAY
jgi:hypothetical protein